MTEVATICFFAAAVGITLANGASNAMKRRVYNRTGKSFRVLSRQLVREYRVLYGQDQNYWAYCFSLLAFVLGMAGFIIFPLVFRK
jgi:hypothetical protein